MRVGFIGAGNQGGTIARQLSAAGHQVLVSNSRGIEGVQAFADEIGAIAADMRGVIDGADAIVLSIPLPAIATLPKDLFEAVPSTVSIIDTGNYYPGMRDPHIPEIDQGLPESIWVAERLGRPVVKAFNDIFAYSLQHLGRPSGSPDRLAIAVAGDHEDTKRVTRLLADSIGFDSVDTGPLAESWRQQPGTPVYCCDYDAETAGKALAAAIKEAAPKQRDRALEHFKLLWQDDSMNALRRHNAMVAINRLINPLP